MDIHTLAASPRPLHAATGLAITLALALTGPLACATGATESETSRETDSSPGAVTFTSGFTSAPATAATSDAGTMGGTAGDGDGDGDGDDDDDDDDSVARCGNGAVEPGEACDGGDLGGKTCESEGFGGGGLTCTPDCTLDTSNCVDCGNGVVDDGEECDGADLGASESCADLGLGNADEALTCTPGCMYDFSECSGCGDGVVTPPEQCEPAGEFLDKADLDGKTCAILGYDDGLLDCNQGCTFNTDSCYVCGDAVQQGQEECDGADFDDLGCADFPSMIGDPFNAGSLSCNDGCKIDTSNCSLCGDAEITGAEACDTQYLGGETCITQGFDGGQLDCASDCSSFDVSACTDCGDGVIEGAEQCDFNNLNGETCVSMGFPGGGALGCTLDCVFDTSQCADNFCGDGLVNGSDDCDCGDQGQDCSAPQLDGETCQSQGFDGGELACNSPNNCSFNTSGCYTCGDGNIDPGEACDGGNLGGETCISLGFSGGGSLSCDNSCELDTSQCVQTPNPLTVCVSPNLAIALDGPQDPSVINVGDAGTVTDVNVYIDCLHTWPGDLGFTLTHAGQSSVIIDQPGVPDSLFGCSTDNIDATLDDEGSSPVEDECAGVAPGIGSPPNFTPNNALSNFDGTSMQGSWELDIEDFYPLGDDGTLLEWCVEISWQ